MSQDWDIKSPAVACQACRRPFDDGESYCSCLVFGADGYVRTDRCEPCAAAAEQPAKPHSAWKGVYHAPPPEPEPPLRKDTAESLLRKLMEERDDAHLNIVFILAVMLERNRILVERDVKKREDGLLLRVYEHRKTGETFLVTEPRLRLDQLEDVQRDVIERLGGKPPDAGRKAEKEADAPTAGPAPG